MIIQSLNYIETAKDDSIQGGATGSSAFVTVRAAGPSFATFGANTSGLSIDVGLFGFSFDAGSAGAGGAVFGLLGVSANAGSSTVTV